MLLWGLESPAARIMPLPNLFALEVEEVVPCTHWRALRLHKLLEEERRCQPRRSRRGP
jgi:hypothetical protein